MAAHKWFSCLISLIYWIDLRLSAELKVNKPKLSYILMLILRKKSKSNTLYSVQQVNYFTWISIMLCQNTIEMNKWMNACAQRTNNNHISHGMCLHVKHFCDIEIHFCVSKCLLILISLISSLIGDNYSLNNWMKKSTKRRWHLHGAKSADYAHKISRQFSIEMCSHFSFIVVLVCYSCIAVNKWFQLFYSLLQLEIGENEEGKQQRHWLI